MKMTPFDRTLVAVFLVPPWTLLIMCCYWYFIDIDPPAKHTSVEVMDERGKPITQIKRGGVLVLARESCVTDEGKAFYTRQMSSLDRKLIYFMPSGEVQLLKGCFKRYNDITIPSYVEPGRYDYIVTVVFDNNPLVQTRMVLPIPTFEVLP